jgi:hypothetical protein
MFLSIAQTISIGAQRRTCRLLMIHGSTFHRTSVHPDCHLEYPCQPAISSRRHVPTAGSAHSQVDSCTDVIYRYPPQPQTISRSLHPFRRCIMTTPQVDLERIAKLQSRHQIVLIVLSVVVALSTLVTWKSVAALREANEAQRQAAATRRTDAPAKGAFIRRPSASQQSAADSEPRRASTFSSGRERATDRQPSAEAPRSTQVAGANTTVERPGRQ